MANETKRARRLRQKCKQTEINYYVDHILIENQRLEATIHSMSNEIVYLRKLIEDINAQLQIYRSNYQHLIHNGPSPNFYYQQGH